jgi:hypothetical protein
MATTFSEFVFKNNNGIKVILTLESPIGAQIEQVEVLAGKSVTLRPNVEDARAAKVTIAAPDHFEGYEDVETFELSGVPYLMSIQTLTVEAFIGSVHGVLTAAF